jgi:hypothetical protein
VQRGQHRVDALVGAQLRVQQPARGIVDDHDQALALVRPQRQPRMLAAIQVQHLAEARARWPAQAVPPARAPLLDQPRQLQRLPHEAV